MELGEEIVMTPSKRGGVTQIRVEKTRKDLIDNTSIEHRAGGQHKGLTIAKKSDKMDDTPPDLQLQFKAWLLDARTNMRVPESRILKYYFRPNCDYDTKMAVGFGFFRELITPENFPRDYVNFIKLVMLLMKLDRYFNLYKVDCELQQLSSAEAGDATIGMNAPEELVVDDRPRDEIVQESLLLTLEQAFPNAMSVDELQEHAHASEEEVRVNLSVLKSRNLAKDMGDGYFWMRDIESATQNEVQFVKKPLTAAQTGSEMPTIAIITAQYCEKQAVDAMIENKSTFVRYNRSAGESIVYTLGYIGSHRVISTKLPMLGRTRTAHISSGNNTTRLLGTFATIDHLFLVGCGGGVPHFTDFHKHSRLGDIVVSKPDERGHIYYLCDKVLKDRETNELTYTMKSWGPSDNILHEISLQLQSETEVKPELGEWHEYFKEGFNNLAEEENATSFTRPSPNTDRLYMAVGGDDVIEVGHPQLPDAGALDEYSDDSCGLSHPQPPEGSSSPYLSDSPNVRLGGVGAGVTILQHEQLKQDFCTRNDIYAFDTEYDQVLDSICGSRKESFTIIRGIADYLDGSKGKLWQPYAALVAAAYMKTVILRVPLRRQSMV